MASAPDALPQTINVAITGCGWPDGAWNISAVVRDRMPFEIKREGKPTIQIFKYPIDRPNIYSHFRRTTPKLWAGQHSTFESKQIDDGSDKLRIDYMLHMGQGGAWREGWTCVEKIARKDCYDASDLDGQKFPREQLGPGGLWEFHPDTIETDFDSQKAAADLAAQFPDEKVRVSFDAGAFFCELGFYHSLALLHERNELKKVVFFHVSPATEAKEINTRVALATSLVQILADQLPTLGL